LGRPHQKRAGNAIARLARLPRHPTCYCTLETARSADPKPWEVWPEDKSPDAWMKIITDSVWWDALIHFVRTLGDAKAVAALADDLTDQTTLLKGPFHLFQKNANSAKPVEAHDYFESLVPAQRAVGLPWRRAPAVEIAR
jgi:hypothetical protein